MAATVRVFIQCNYSDTPFVACIPKFTFPPSPFLSTCQMVRETGESKRSGALERVRALANALTVISIHTQKCTKRVQPAEVGETLLTFFSSWLI